MFVLTTTRYDLPFFPFSAASTADAEAAIESWLRGATGKGGKGLRRLCRVRLRTLELPSSAEDEILESRSLGRGLTVKIQDRVGQTEGFMHGLSRFTLIIHSPICKIIALFALFASLCPLCPLCPTYSTKKQNNCHVGPVESK